MADASRHKLSAVLESSYGVTPVSPVFESVRHTELSLGLSKNTQISEELKENRQIQDFKHGAKQVGGDLGFELSYGTYDAFFEAVLLSDSGWNTIAPINDTTFSVDDSDGSFNDSGNGFLAAGFKPGDKFTSAGFTTGANNSTFEIKSVVAGKIVVIDATGLVTEAAGDSVTFTVTSANIVAGVTRRSFSVLREFSDFQVADKPFHLFNGVEYNNMTLTITADAKVTGTFTTLGRDQEPTSETEPAGSTYNAATTTKVMDSFTGTISEGGVVNGVVTELTLNMENGLEPRFVVGSDKTILPTVGRSNLSGNLTAYFENSDLLDKFINEDESTLDLTLVDADGNSYHITMPRVKYNAGQPDVSGQGAITLAMPFQALYDADLDTNVIFTRIAA
ncbi:MAG: hypothetical protein CMI54_06335 [Parcubacteria group bacterium]|jgi:hypothetical protein|nr:hypothetical protein [Parcubacteria group bacterium]|tara:strand:- start:3056 stop:4231 length:1176 start_codon:yes stop_codon:yes gene_type:complete